MREFPCGGWTAGAAKNRRPAVAAGFIAADAAFAAWHSVAESHQNATGARSSARTTLWKLTLAHPLMICAQSALARTRSSTRPVCCLGRAHLVCPIRPIRMEPRILGQERRCYRVGLRRTSMLNVARLTVASDCERRVEWIIANDTCEVPCCCVGG